jgi:hypothetical protein
MIIQSIAIDPNEDNTGAQHRAPSANALARDLGWIDGGRDCAAEEQDPYPASAQTHEVNPAGLEPETGETTAEIRVPPSS